VEKELKFKLLFYEEEDRFRADWDENFEKYFEIWQKIEKNFISPVLRWEDGIEDWGHWNNELYINQSPPALFWLQEWDNAPGYNKYERRVFVFVP